MVGRGSERGSVALRVRYEGSCLPQQQDTIPYVVKNLSLALLKMGKFCPKHVELILEINKTVIVASRWFLYYLIPFYLCAFLNTVRLIKAFKTEGPEFSTDTKMRLCIGPLRNQPSIFARNKRFLSSSKCQDSFHMR